MTLSRLFLSLLLSALPAAAGAAPRTDYLYERIVTEVVVPGFRDLDEAAAAHAAAWSRYCAEPSAEIEGALVDSFQHLADRWAEIEMAKTGPASEAFRHERFYFWPERKNAVERGLAALLKNTGGDALSAARIAGESAAVQGLPALERLLYADGGPDPQLGRSDTGKRRCRAGEAIAGNAARLAREMHAGWRERAGLIDEAVKSALATDLVTAYAVVKDVKIEPVIGDDGASAKPRAAEFWRSGRPMRAIVLNLEALARVNAILFETAADEVALPQTTQSALAIARSLPADLAALAAGAKRSDAILLRDAVDAAADRAQIELPAALGVTVGFNSLDGD